MSPSALCFYPAYVALIDAVVFRYLRLRSSIFANFSDLFRRKLGASDPLSMQSCAVPDHIGTISCPRIPPQIFKHIIFVVSIVMTALHSRVSFSPEGRNNKSANLGVLLVPAAAESDKWPTILNVINRRSDTPGFYRPHPSLVRNFVFWPIGDFFPYFHGAMPGINMRMGQE